MGFLENLMKKSAGARGRLCAPVKGRLMPLASVPDISFAQGLLGDGCGIDPDGEVVYAPADGTLAVVAKTLHAVGIITDDGAEILIHVGMDTVDMQGRGFEALARQGDRIHRGQKLLRFSREEIEKDGLSPIIGFVISNSGDMQEVSFECDGQVEPGDEIGRYRK